MPARRTIYLLFLLGATLAGAQVTSDFTLTASPVLNIPVGPRVSEDVPLYSIAGAGLSVKGEYALPFARFLYTGIVLDVDWLPTNGLTSFLVTLSTGPEVGIQFYPIRRLGIRLAGYGGMYIGFTPHPPAIRNPFVAGLLDVSFLVKPSLSIGVGAQYRASFIPDGVVYHGAGVTVGARWHMGAGSGKARLEVMPNLQPIFPLFFGYYDKNAAGSVVLHNDSKAPIENVTVSFFAKQFMEQPKICQQIKRLNGGADVEVPVYALFADSIFSVTEGMKVAGEIAVAYRYLGADAADSFPVTVTVNNRNAMSWDDTNKAAAFVTAKDPAILGFTKKVAADAKARVSPLAFSTAFRTAMALFEAMDLQGIGYTQDPSTPYASLSQDATSVDYLQFPLQTLTYRAGDCDDLSILYAALLESVGIKSAFVTAPGHIYVAFDVDVPAAEARGTIANPDDLIYREDGTWLPVEVTRVRDGFLRAWREGASEWRRTSGNQTAGFYPVETAWTTYAPVSSATVVQTPPTLPDSDRVYREMSAELGRFVQEDLRPREATLKKEIARAPADVKLLNKLGVLYARFGMLGEAKTQFETIARVATDVPVSVLVNLGNIAYLDAKYKEAMDRFRAALVKNPESTAALLGLLFAAYESGDQETAEAAYTALKKVDPVTAAKYERMGTGAGGASRAASAEGGVTAWGDD